MKLSYDEHITKIDTQVEDIISRAQAYMQTLDENVVREYILLAYDFAKEAHKKEKRLSGEPYISHPVAATEILLGLSPDISTIQACLLHDVIEDTSYTYEDILDAFWKDVADLCAGMEKLEKVKYRWEDRAVGSLRKMFLAMAEDLRVIFIKLSDRLHNMQTLKSHPKPEKRKRIALETLNIYIPIAGRLGLYTLKAGLEEECFKILHPADYKKLIKELAETQEERQAFKNSAIIEIQNLIRSMGIEHKVDFRVKSAYSIYQKLQRKNVTHPKDLYDIYGIRIIVPSIGDCYRVLGEIHNAWHTLPYRFKDYIALPKPNGYQSIHTTIVGFLKDCTKQPTEIQIRTETMHTQAEIWIAAHFEYKEVGSKIAKEVSWVKDLKEMVENMGNNDLIDSLKIDTFKNRIFVFTPKWDLINLPTGSTPVDFAYHVHTDIWDHTTIAKVNGVVQPLDKELQNGDVIEIVTDKHRKPSEFWMSFVQTVKAKNSIKSYLRRGDKETHRDRWKNIMNRYLEKSWLAPLDKDLTVLKVIDDRELNTQERLQLLEQVGNFSITPASLLKRILKSLNIAYESQNKKTPPKVENDGEEPLKNTLEQVVIWGEENIPYKICKNCIGKTRELEKIVSHINSKWQFTIHNRSCHILKWVNTDRLMNAYVKWSSGGEMSIFRMSMIVDNKPWVFKLISETLYTMEINIEELHTKKLSKDRTELILWLQIHDYEYLVIDRFLERIKHLLGDTIKEYTLKQIQS